MRQSVAKSLRRAALHAAQEQNLRSVGGVNRYLKEKWNGIPRSDRGSLIPKDNLNG